MFLQYIVDVLSLGSLYALFALGLVLVYGILKLVNFDNDEFEKAKAAQNEQFVSARKKGPNWINLHLQDSFEGQKYLTSKIKNLLDPEVKI